MSLKVVFVLNVSCGGAERVTLQYAKILKTAGYDCHLVFMQCAQPDGFPMLEFVPQDMPWTSVKGRARYSIFRLYQELRRMKPDIVFGSLVPVNNCLLIYKRLGLLKCKVAIRMNTSPQRIHALHSLLAKRLFAHADLIISQTEEMREEMASAYNIKSDRIVTINNPIDKTLINEKLNEPSVLDMSFINYVAVGRLHPVKDYLTLIRAFERVHIVNQRSRLYIVGGCSNQSYRDELITFVEEKRLSSFVFFEGFQSNPYKYLVNSNVFVLSSIKEGLPNVLLEAIYLGIPVVSTLCVPFVEKVIKPTNGYIVSVGNAEQLADAMLNAVNIRDLKRFDDPIKSDDIIVREFMKL